MALLAGESHSVTTRSGEAIQWSNSFQSNKLVMPQRRAWTGSTMINSDARYRSLPPPINRHAGRVDSNDVESGATGHLGGDGSDGCHRTHFAQRFGETAASTGRLLRRRCEFPATPRSRSRARQRWSPNGHRDPIFPTPIRSASSVSTTPTRSSRRPKHLSSVMLTRPDGADADYQDRVRQGSGIEGGCLSATVPLLDGELHGRCPRFHQVRRPAMAPTTRSTRCGRWPRCSAQIQARVVAEERLLNLAFHDELTGLANRRALVGYLARRMENGVPGPVAVIFIDVDRLKARQQLLGSRRR